MVTKFVIGYAGSLAYFGGSKKKSSWIRDYFWTYNHIQTDSSTRSPYYLFLAVRELKKKGVITPDNFSLLFWGAIDKRNVTLAGELGVAEFLTVLGHKSKAETRALLAECSMLFLPLESSAIGEPLFIPGKLYEYLYIGKPILAFCEADSDAGQLLLNSKIATLIPPNSAEMAEKKIEDLIKNPSQALVKRVPAELLSDITWQSMTEKIAKIFDKTLGENE